MGSVRGGVVLLPSGLKSTTLLLPPTRPKLSAGHGFALAGHATASGKTPAPLDTEPLGAPTRNLLTKAGTHKHGHT